MPVKKPYRVRRTVDRSMRYFEANYLAKHLLHDDDDDDDEASPPSAKPSTTSQSLQRHSSSKRSPVPRTASVRSNMHFKLDSAINSDEVHVTNIKR